MVKSVLLMMHWVTCAVAVICGGNCSLTFPETWNASDVTLTTPSQNLASAAPVLCPSGGASGSRLGRRAPREEPCGGAPEGSEGWGDDDDDTPPAEAEAGRTALLLSGGIAWVQGCSLGSGATKAPPVAVEAEAIMRRHDGEAEAMM